MSGKYNRQGVDISNIEIGATIAYQCGKGTAPKLAEVLEVNRRGSAIRTSAGVIAEDYVLAIVPKYVAPKPKPIDDKWHVHLPNGKHHMAKYQPAIIEPIGLRVGDDKEALALAMRIVQDHNRYAGYEA
jgi:hypothetical protein